ncbi:hypothetical protein [Hasllibacter sp. MH4015]|uniref:hypothetical protein n=1 Tax=Hasllibacter sp. MH4015 TaxID=2854029 RepID=UPI001CD76936|nr:hypothetical protein [Hasllibacter sp. MH4015]
MRRALAGLALFVCLMAAGWAWQEFATIAPGPDHEGTFVRVTVMEGREALCADTSDRVPEGTMRIGSTEVSRPGGACRIASRVATAQGGAELALICGDDPRGPDGYDALLALSGPYAEWTGYVETEADAFFEAHATFIRCENV